MAVLERDYRIDGIKWLLIVLVTYNLHFSYAIICLYQWLLCKC